MAGGRQELSVNQAAAEAAAEVLRRHGIECEVNTRLD
jgi:NAD(P)H-dependent FMN reductase